MHERFARECPDEAVLVCLEDLDTDEAAGLFRFLEVPVPAQDDLKRLLDTRVGGSDVRRELHEDEVRAIQTHCGDVYAEVYARPLSAPA